jgi:hypothetical protein
VLDFFPDLQIANLDERKQALTLEHLLMLAPGYECADADGTEAEMVQSQDWAQFVLDLPMKAEPGTEWSYCSSAVHLVSAILQQATGMDARTFANQHLFRPIGIGEVPPERWPSDPQGISTGGNGLQLTPVEIARFAYLYLNHGRWGEVQVVPEEWVIASTEPHVHVGKMKAYGDMDRSYGYLWSLYPEQRFYSALGRNGQHIHVFPEEDMLVIFTSATSLFSDEKQFDLLKDYILPAIQGDTALDENPAGAAELEAKLAEAAEPLRPVAALPPAGERLNGKPIRIGDNPFGWKSITFHFEEGADSAEIEFDDGQKLVVGLDNLYRVQEIPGTGPVGFRGAWDREDRFTLQQIFPGTWMEFEINLTVKGNQVIIFQKNVVDGGNLVRVVGEIEE